MYTGNALPCSRPYEFVIEMLTASAPWLMSLNLLRSKPGTVSCDPGSGDGAADSTIVSRSPS